MLLLDFSLSFSSFDLLGKIIGILFLKLFTVLDFFEIFYLFLVGHFTHSFNISIFQLKSRILKLCLLKLVINIIHLICVFHFQFLYVFFQHNFIFLLFLKFVQVFGVFMIQLLCNIKSSNYENSDYQDNKI